MGRKKTPLPKENGREKNLLPFDRETGFETEAKLQKIRAEMEVEMDSKLSKQKIRCKEGIGMDGKKIMKNHHTE